MRDYIDNPHLKVRGEPSSVGNLRRPLLLAGALVLAAGLLLWLDIAGHLGPTPGMLRQLLSPVARPLTALQHSVTGFWNDLGELGHLREENEALRQQVSQLQADLIALEEAELENARLRQQLAIEEEKPWRLLGAEVTMRSPDAGRRVMTISRGSQDRVREGMPVVGQTGSGPVALVGIVEEVSEHTATVLMTTDFGSRVSVRVLHENLSSLGLVQGQWQRGSRLRLEQVEAREVLVPGAIVVSAGLSGELQLPLPLAAVPSGIPIGEIATVSSDGSATFAELWPYADPDQVYYVWVILSQQEK